VRTHHRTQQSQGVFAASSGDVPIQRTREDVRYGARLDDPEWDVSFAATPLGTACGTGVLTLTSGDLLSNNQLHRPPDTSL